MNLYMEANRKYGYGYQVRIDKQAVLDNEPYNLYEAVHVAGKALDRINEMTGSSHQLYEVLWLTQDGVEANAYRDIASAKLAMELRSGARKYIEVADRLEGE